MAALLSSVMLKRDRGIPRSWGSSQARALIVITVLGGKPRRSAVARSIVEPLEAFLEEPFSPLADDLGRGVEPSRDILVLETVGSIQNDLGANDISIR
jgi:hypothetical protein